MEKVNVTAVKPPHGSVACKACPFRDLSGTTYDADAMEALDEGNEPSCHRKVGHSSIFYEVFPKDDIACFGYREWMNETPGFSKPKQTLTTD
ncbi:hypothetical protein LP414_27370 [Polaromonas sp. P1(28)-13]|nr:hypothetical protein LP414_27370 [Polaromonas sp. P1(28)-13]